LRHAGGTLIGTAVASGGQYLFGPFRLLAAQQLLLEGDAPVRVGGRARDILNALLERPGQVMSKEELIARVWPNTFVEEGSLKVHVAALRKALGDGQAGNRYIANIPGRGYCFVGRVTFSEESQGSAPYQAESPERPNDLPAPLSRMVGRAEVVQSIADQLQKHRFVTIVGPGGIGKTTVALAVANGLIAAFADGVRFVDLAPLSDALLVPSALAAALGVSPRSAMSTKGLVSLLRDRRVLIVLDNCEHLIEAVAALAEEVFIGAGQTHILATSRESLRVDGERVHRLAPLESPPERGGLKASDALAFPAVQLFVERAAASMNAFELTDAEAPIVANICRRLDGIALAIEIAAGRADTFGVGGLAERLNDRFGLMMRGRRTALTRHQTLSTTLDWSYVLLPEFERIALRRLAIFVGVFTMESANAVLSDERLPVSELANCVANLVAKSLIAANVDGPVAFYRLLDMTRTYALLKLDEGGERSLIARRHAGHFRNLLEKAGISWRERPARAWVEDHRHLTDNVRAALDWAFSPEGDAAIGVAIAVAAVPLWFQLSFVEECGKCVRLALSAADARREPGQEMQLHAAQAWSLMQTRGSVSETRAAWLAVLNLAEGVGDDDYQLRALWGLWAGLLNNAELRSALSLAKQFYDLAATRADLSDRLVGDRMIGYILHLLGDQAGARRHIERMLAEYAVPTAGAQIIRFIFDQRTTARCFLARILWLQGFPDQAVAMVESVVEEALAGNDILSVCQALVQAACPVSLLVGDIARLDRFVAMLLDYAAKHSLEFWQAWGRCFESVLVIRRGDTTTGLQRLNAAIRDLRDIGYGVYYIVFLSEFAEASGRAGNVGQGLAAIEEALARCERNEEHWYIAELLRVKGVLLLGKTPGDAAAAQDCFLTSLRWSHSQKTLSWELRAALDFSRMLANRGEPARALKLITPIYDAFQEGHETADLRAARLFIEGFA
jgi:predicted ATPase/DNA-binding winged helix-turn-helix (wHTH) protein